MRSDCSYPHTCLAHRMAFGVTRLYRSRQWFQLSSVLSLYSYSSSAFCSLFTYIVKSLSRHSVHVASSCHMHRSVSLLSSICIDLYPISSPAHLLVLLEYTPGPASQKSSSSIMYREVFRISARQRRLETRGKGLTVRHTVNEHSQCPDTS